MKSTKLMPPTFTFNLNGKEKGAAEKTNCILQLLMMLERFGWKENKIIRTIETLGNCVAASIPATLYEGVRDGRIQRGNKVLLVGTGAGLSIGGLVLTF